MRTKILSSDNTDFHELWTGLYCDLFGMAHSMLQKKKRERCDAQVRAKCPVVSTLTAYISWEKPSGLNRTKPVSYDTHQ
jgi:hypothetical protein